MLKVETIRAFVTVAHHGNLRDAADELGRTQSALSMALTQLERTLGGPLFESDRKRNLTDLGRFVRDMGQDLVRENDRILSLIEGYAKGDAGHLRIASVPSVASLILPRILAAFMQTHAGARIDLMDSDSTTVRRMVANGQADLGIAGPAPAGQALRAEDLFLDTLHVVCPRTHRFASQPGALTWQDLSGASLIANETLSVVESPEARSVVAESKLSVRNISSLFAMIEAGMGVTVLPGLATRGQSETLIARPIAGNGNRRTISLLADGGRSESPLSRAFRAHLRDGLPELMDRYRL